jgi:hypothetical protein
MLLALTNVITCCGERQTKLGKEWVTMNYFGTHRQKDVITWSVYSMHDAFDGHYDDIPDRFDEQFYST